MIYHIKFPPFYFAFVPYTIIPVSATPVSRFINLCSLCQAFHLCLSTPFTPASGGLDGFNTNKGLMVIIDSLT